MTSSGVLYGRSISFREINTTCQKIKEHVRLLGTGAKTISIIEPFSGLGLIFAAFLPIYSGAEVLFISPGWAEVRISKIIETIMLAHMETNLVTQADRLDSKKNMEP